MYNQCWERTRSQCELLFRFGTKLARQPFFTTKRDFRLKLLFLKINIYSSPKPSKTITIGPVCVVRSHQRAGRYPENIFKKRKYPSFTTTRLVLCVLMTAKTIRIVRRNRTEIGFQSKTTYTRPNTGYDGYTVNRLTSYACAYIVTHIPCTFTG